MAVTEQVKNKKYLVRVAYRDGLGKPYSRDKVVHGTEKDALHVEMRLLEEINKGIVTEMSLRSLFDAYLESKPNIKDETKRKEVEIFSKFLVDLSRTKIANISPYQLITLRNQIESMEGSVTQKNKAIYLIKSIYKFGNKAFGYNDIAQHIETIRPKVKEKFVYNTLTPEEFNTIIGYEKIEVYRLVYEIYFWAGLRRGEAIALFKNDLLTSMELDIYNSVNSKGELGPPKNSQSYRRVGIHQNLYSRLLPHANSKGKYLLGGLINLAPNTINRRFTICQRKSNKDREENGSNPLPHLRIHDLRHSHATFLASQGVPITVVSHRLGHASIAETMNTYLHLFKGDDIRALAAIDNYLSPIQHEKTTIAIQGDLETRIKSVIKGESLTDIEASFDAIVTDIKTSFKY